MNWYTCASKIRKAADKAKKNAEKYLDQLRSSGINIGPEWDNYAQEQYDRVFEREKEEFEKTLNLGLELYSKWKELRPNQLTTDRWYMLTVRPPHDTNFNTFKHNWEHFVSTWSNKWISYIYVYEQKGETPENAGHGFHVHCLFNTSTPNYYPSHVARDAIREFPYVNKACIKAESVKCITRAFEYLDGKKENADKEAAVAIDALWRETLGLPASVKYNLGRLEIESE